MKQVEWVAGSPTRRARHCQTRWGVSSHGAHEDEPHSEQLLKCFPTPLAWNDRSHELLAATSIREASCIVPPTCPCRPCPMGSTHPHCPLRSTCHTPGALRVKPEASRKAEHGWGDAGSSHLPWCLVHHGCLARAGLLPGSTLLQGALEAVDTQGPAPHAEWMLKEVPLPRWNPR